MLTGFWPTRSGVNGTYSSGCSLRPVRTQPAMMPDSTSYSLSPTIGRFGGCWTFARSMTNFDVSTNFSVLMPTSTPCRHEQRQDDVLHRHVAGALAEARDGRVRHRRARLQRRERVRDAETEVLVTVDLDRLLQALDDLRHDDRDGVGRDDAERVGDRERVHVAFGGDLRDDVEEAVELGARRVDREEDRVEAGFLRRERRVDGRLHRAVERPAVARS